MDDIRLYHGSKSGIKGMIAPTSRKSCDFGQGFYMGTNPDQAKTLIFEKENPMLYTLDLALSEIPESKILTLDGNIWAFFVLYNREQLNAIKHTELYQCLDSLADDKDVIIGPIADDKMAVVMEEFINNSITDKVLTECLKTIDYGTQYVAKTRSACTRITIHDKERLNPDNYDKYQGYLNNVREESNRNVEELRLKYLREGNYFIEILQNPHLQKQIIDEIRQLS